jgi:hypothetical protein
VTGELGTLVEVGSGVGLIGPEAEVGFVVESGIEWEGSEVQVGIGTG